MASSILRLLTSTFDNNKAAGTHAEQSKLAAGSDRDASLFSMVMASDKPQPKSKPAATSSSNSNDRASTVEARSSASDSRDKTTKNSQASDSDSSNSDGQASERPEAESTALVDVAAEQPEVVVDELREGDVVEVPDGYLEEAIADLTKDPHTESVALGLLVGQAVPVQLPVSGGFFGDAAIVVPETVTSANALPLNAPSSLPIDAALIAETPVTTPVINPEQIALPADGNADGQFALPPELLAEQGGAEVVIDPALLRAAPELLQAAKQTEQAAVKPDAELLKAQTQVQAPEAVEAGTPVAEVAEVAAQPVARRLGKIAPAAQLQEAVSITAPVTAEDGKQAKSPAAPPPLTQAKEQAPEVVRDTMPSLGAQPQQRQPVEAAAKFGVAPVINAEAVTTPISTGNTRSSDALSSTQGTGGLGFTSTLQSAVQIANAQATTRAGVAEQITAQIASLPRNKGTQFTLQLNPGDLGEVDVVMDFHKNGQVHLTIRAETAEALQNLQRDAVMLERSLQELGLKTDSGSLQFSLRQDQQGNQAQQFGDAQQQNSQSRSGHEANSRGNGGVNEEPVALGQVNYRIPRNDRGLDIQV